MMHKGPRRRPPRARPEELSCAGGRVHGHPRPQLWREGWESLNGTWDFAIDRDGRLSSPGEVAWTRTIEVPFSPEAPRSGVGDTSLFRRVWYRRDVELGPLPPGERVVLHFGAVDHEATVFVDRVRAATHTGGYTPFSLDLTPYVASPGRHEIVVRADDDPADLAKPRGKQDWQLEPHSIWYPRTTGIWQTVWLERLPATSIGAARWTPSLDRWELDLDVSLEGARRDDLTLWLRLSVDDELLGEDTYRVVAGAVHRRVALSDPGIDDSRNDLLWSPTSPTLIDAELELRGPDGAVVDRAHGYTALRSVAVQGDRVVLNGQPCPLQLVLDQGYWPEGGLTAPDDEALRRDVELVRAMGFNGVRKHQKIEDPRFLYWADRLGLLVWEELPSAYRYTAQSIERLTEEWIAAIRRDFSHPSVIAWVPFNESWGVPNLPDSAPERHWVEALYHLTKTLDPTRLVIGNDGWEVVATDLVGIHDYDADPARLARRYVLESRQHLLRRERPGGRQIVLAGPDRYADHPVVLSEFGGIALRRSPPGAWGYSFSDDTTALADAYTALLTAVRSVELFSGFCYTQLTDTYQEQNGLLYVDRTPKFPIEEIAAATRRAEAGAVADDPLGQTSRDGPRKEGHAEQGEDGSEGRPSCTSS
jgi:hypothetical protein